MAFLDQPEILRPLFTTILARAGEAWVDRRRRLILAGCRRGTSSEARAATTGDSTHAKRGRERRITNDRFHVDWGSNARAGPRSACVLIFDVLTSVCLRRSVCALRLCRETTAACSDTSGNSRHSAIRERRQDILFRPYHRRIRLSRSSPSSWVSMRHRATEHG